MATCTELFVDTLGGLDLDGSTDKNLPYFVVEKLATLPYIHCTYIIAASWMAKLNGPLLSSCSSCKKELRIPVLLKFCSSVSA